MSVDNHSLEVSPQDLVAWPYQNDEQSFLKDLAGKTKDDALAQWYKWRHGSEEYPFPHPHYNRVLNLLTYNNFNLIGKAGITTADVLSNEIVNANDFFRIVEVVHQSTFEDDIEKALPRDFVFLDYGAGMGRNMSWFSLLNKNYEYYGYDEIEESRRVFRTYLSFMQSKEPKAKLRCVEKVVNLSTLLYELNPTHIMFSHVLGEIHPGKSLQILRDTVNYILKKDDFKPKLIIKGALRTEGSLCKRLHLDQAKTKNFAKYLLDSGLVVVKAERVHKLFDLSPTPFIIMSRD